ncbi:MAG: cobalamin biosynthesis bifunctional protein CbiET [Candidatus Contendobacter odensis]|uniref:Cobalamin biosynthesis bifunctional protein CbiET n=1 Tax=Candidatus Contendibacter odensensis TaxID=1400860 RepID=A0A2G6PEC9_9GAMM|nr:MAG: cobalamin biosynthesis bifunctional protein CbiET [Candidatus Contendobacter odensis]
MTLITGWSGSPVHVIGMGINTGTLEQTAQTALEQAELIIGSKAHLALFSGLNAEKCPYPSPMSGLPDLLSRNMQRRIVLLASGDPLFHGIGSTIARYLPAEHLHFHPNVSSLQAAFARRGRAWQQTRWFSLHGKPLASLRAILHRHRQYALLTDRRNTPPAIARELVKTGFGDSDLWVAEDLGAPKERFQHFRATDLLATNTEFSALNVIILETHDAVSILPEFPGIPDEHFSTDGSEPGKGLITKREVRLMILSLLAPRSGDIGWDVGAGCGGVSVEWARWNPDSTIYAIEYHPERLNHLGINRERFGVISNLNIVAARAPEALDDLSDPHAVFIGGSSGNLLTMLNTVWARLQPGGRLVASAVTEDSRVDLHQFAHNRDAIWSELSIARGKMLAGQRILQPYLPIVLMKVEKPA